MLSSFNKTDSEAFRGVHLLVIHYKNLKSNFVLVVVGTLFCFRGSRFVTRIKVTSNFSNTDV